MIHPFTKIQYLDEIIGYGIFATQYIPAGTIIYIKDSLELEIDNNHFNNHSLEMQYFIEKYSYRDEKGVRILSWDFAKYVNHCCQSNTLSTAYGFDITVRDIEEGDEITCDYAMLNIEQDMNLFCVKPQCRKIVSPRDFEKCYPIWDQRIQGSLHKVFDLYQPLMHLLGEEQIEFLKLFVFNQASYKSVKTLKFESQTII